MGVRETKKPELLLVNIVSSMFAVVGRAHVRSAFSARVHSQESQKLNAIILK
ncbi:hypothetical protein [Tychonema sp. LEGE 07203]|uniref:hypothetical protein n=1 Tax=Tychonema sp. LEGE 07203 TaxID=1828671 RepID=UPI0018828DF1|nr:hypothetical protein [Tychonema sp. LEGE 07203]MBE9093073.1 hypothetical protein [Tychonema sp. LEGE 07203]